MFNIDAKHFICRLCTSKNIYIYLRIKANIGETASTYIHITKV